MDWPVVHLCVGGHYPVDFRYVVSRYYPFEEAQMGLFCLWPGILWSVLERSDQSCPLSALWRDDGRFCCSTAALSGFIYGKTLIMQSYG